MRLLINVALLVIFSIAVSSQNTEKEEDYDGTSDDEMDTIEIIPFTHLCSFERPMLNHSIADDEDFCNCDIVSSSVIGRPSVKIDCELSDHVRNLTNRVFQAQKLPVNTVSLVLSYQHFTEVPEFIGDQLKYLDMSNNLITVLKDSNFIHTALLEHLDLSYNFISDIQSQAFEGLQLLHHLDMSVNELVVLPANVFSPLVTLETLILSSNEGFGPAMGKEVMNSTLTSLYLHLDVTPKLSTLIMERCHLTKINLSPGVGLKTINLSFNNIVDLWTLALPENVQSLELSGNPIRHFTENSLPHLNALEKLILEDLPFLGQVSSHALSGFPKLSHVTFEGSKNLSFIDSQAFGEENNDEDTEQELKILNLRGCSLRTLNSSLEKFFNRLDEFHLEGNPINCNCNMKWLKYLKVETNARCYKPEVLSGKLLSEVADKKMKCENYFMRKLLNTMILLLLLIACSLAIWYFLSRLNPSRRHKFQKVGPESPYQPVTIEPNRAEYSLY